METLLIFIVNLYRFVGIVLWTTAMWIDGWQNLKREECPAPTCHWRVGASAEKILYSIFWDQKGVILSYPLPKSMTITGESYRDILKNKLLPAVAEKRPELVGNFILHQDNTPTQGSNCHRISGGTWNWDTSTSSLFTWPCSERFLVVWHPETLSPRKTISFEIKSRFSSLPVSKTHT